MIDFEVKGQETFKVAVMIQIRQDAVPSDHVHRLVLRFRGPGGNPFGDPIPLSLQVSKKVEQHSYQVEV